MSEPRMVWLRDENSRVYERGKMGGPTEDSHWHSVPLEGETRVSWIAGGMKFEKATGYARAVNGYAPPVTIWMSVDAMNDERFRRASAHPLAERVARAKGPTLRKIAALLDEADASK